MRRPTVLISGLAVVMAASLASVPASPASAQAPAAPDDDLSTQVDDPDEVLGAGWSDSSDRAVVTSGDATGLHVLVADRRDAYEWRTVATLTEPVLETDQWIGQLCVSGDGSHAVVVYAPRTFTNHPPLMEAGGFAAVVDLDSGDVTKLDQRVTLAYYNPACGADGTAALSRLEQSHEVGEPAKTWIGTVDTASATIEAEVRADGQVTSAVPVDGEIFAAKGDTLVSVAGDGELTMVAHTPGAPLRLMPDGADGLAFQVARGEQVDLARLDAAGDMRVFDTVPLGAVKLRPGAGGDVYATGADASGRISSELPALWRLVDALPDSRPSTEGGLMVTRATTGLEPAGRLVAAPDAGQPHRVDIEAELLDGAGDPLEFAVQPATGVAGGQLSPSLGGPPGVDSGARPEGATPMADYSDVPWDPDRACAVPRNDPQVQVYQPSAKEVEWAVNLAVRGELTANRPANWLNSGLPAYSPQGMFPSLSLSGGGYVPAQIMLAIVAQESNLYQASWRVVDGLGGNPLTSAGFYGLHWENPDPMDIDWQDVDCGYGVAQVTTGMHTSDTDTTVNGVFMDYTKQRAVAQDYAVNVAAGLRILQDKWNQTRDAGLIANNGAPSRLENWWFAVWAYNSGFYPDDGGPWGVGWSNNPASPLYPEDRKMFLTAPLDHPDVDPPDEVGYDNARHPNHWSYPERVMGFAYHSLKRWDYRDQYYADTYQPAAIDGNTEDAQPGRLTFCTTATNECDPENESYVPGEHPGYPQTHCMRDDLMCWWHSPVSWGAPNCGDCGVENRSFTGGDPSPPMANPIYSTDCTGSELPSAAMVIDNLDSADPLGPHGCSRTWGDHGTFELDLGSAAGPYGEPIYPSKVDLHQISGGFGGHFWMTHLRDVGESAMFVNGTWRLDETIEGTARVWVHMPDHGARTTSAEYRVFTEDGIERREIQQYGPGNRWVSIGNFRFDDQPEVRLHNLVSGADGTVSMAFDAVAIEPLPLADICYGEGMPFTPSCTGKDPAEMGCGDDAETLADGISANGVWIDLRYSSLCNAVWTKYENNMTAGTGEAKIRSSSTEYSKELAGYEGEQGWTPMISATHEDLESCLLFWSEFDEWWEFCVEED